MVARMEGNSAAQQELESSKIDNLTRAELNRTMTEWSTRLQTLLESERHKKGTDGASPNLDQNKLQVKYSFICVYVARSLLKQRFVHVVV